MKALLVVTVFLTAAMFVAAPAGAQTTPTVSVFFDQGLTRMDEDCPAGGGMDSAFVVVQGFNAFIMAVEYAINYPPSMNWLYDYGFPPITMGNTPSGITEAFPVPQNAYNPIIVARVVFMWNCDGCTIEDDKLIVSPHPVAGFVRAVDFPNYEFINAVGMTSLVCATVPTEETTWGQIKSLYGE